ncbi:MAG: hypothetical protein JW787_14755 [Sedimentisphaerales bacterium]|nr:hypothetical protein [Sedimentisphaerales bacterium]
MVRNTVITILVVFAAVIITLLFSGRLKWMTNEDLISRNPETILQKAIEMHKPEILKIGDQDILHVPIGKLSGKSWAVNHEFYIYENGSLKKIL